MLQKILVLGDCQSDGNNCLAHQILHQDDLVIDWSLQHHQRAAEVIKWMLSHKTHQNLALHTIKDTAFKFLRQKELEVAWPNFIKNYTVTNLSCKGAHFLGHHKRIKQWVANNPKPDLVILTDYTFDHYVVSFRHQGTTQIFEKGLSYNQSDWNNNHYDQAVHEKIVEKLKIQMSQPRSWFERRHQHAHFFLLQFLKHHDIPWINLKFYGHNLTNAAFFGNFMPTDIECQDIYSDYRVKEIGEACLIKLQKQSVIAVRVQDYLDTYFATSPIKEEKNEPTTVGS
jgi:hypothetical protein